MKIWGASVDAPSLIWLCASAGIALGGVLSASCAWGTAEQLIRESSLPRYPAVFHESPNSSLGIGFSKFSKLSPQESYTHAVEMACRSLAWSTQVRVKGERLFEQTAGDRTESRGENIDLLDLAEIGPEKCTLDTLLHPPYAWVVATDNSTPPQGWKELAALSATAPLWISSTPGNPSWHYATGCSQIAYKNEPGSWELAAYNALVELAFLVKSRVRRLDKSEEIESGSSIVEVDSSLRGVQFVGHWRDREVAYVLARVPVSGATSHLD
ncbi:MAG: hypothetical protein FJY95_23170 [Candidatus Handelsmanbacteria bacterium]|nr:hypothetical protein [Candidatus Handelsmanbacteria bacterium]